MKIRKLLSKDSSAVDELALRAFAQYCNYYNPWEEFREKISKMSEMPMEIFIAEENETICGAVGFVSPGKNSSSHFDPEWSAIRMLVVEPTHRGKGIGRSLTEKCIDQAKQIDCEDIGLHTSPIMETALGLYQRMGFVKKRDIQNIYGVPYGVYQLSLKG